MTELIKSLPQNILEAGAKMGWPTCLSSWVSIGKHYFACFLAEEWEFCVVCFDWNVGTKGDKEQWKAGGHSSHQIYRDGWHQYSWAGEKQ